MDDLNTITSRIIAVELQFEQFSARLAQLENQIAELMQQSNEQRSLKRFVEAKTGRSGEMSSRIAQRLAKCEAAIEILARIDDRETLDHA
jgi:septal ring factor EnvC (AmiA/AmiB activator)